MNDKNTKVKFLTKTNLILLGLIWGLFLIIIFLRRDTLYKDASNIITIFAAFLAFSGILYSNYKSDKRNERSLKNSNKQLVEQLTRDKKEEAVFTLIKDILTIINDDLKEDFHPWRFTAKTIADYYEENKINFDPTNVDFNLFVQNELYFYFSNLVDNPFLFNYLAPEIQNEIYEFTVKYYEFSRDFYLFMGNKVDITIKFNNEYEFEIMEDNRIREEYFNSGNYLINKGIMGHLFDCAFELDDLKLKDKTIVIKIDDEEYNKLNCSLQKIVFLSYNESLKYGYDEL